MLMVSLGGNTTSTLILTIQSPLQTVTEIFNNWVRQRSLAKFRQISRKMQLAQSLSPTRTWSPIWNLSLKFSLTWVSRSKKQLLRVLLLPLLLSENKFRLKSKRAQLSPPWLINSSKFCFIISIFFISNLDMPSRPVGHQQLNKFEILLMLPVQRVQMGQMTMMVSFKNFWPHEFHVVK